MRKTNSTAFAIASVLCLVGCCSTHQSPGARQQAGPEQPVARQPGLTRDEVLQLFRERATPDQIREFEELRVKTDYDSRERAINLVLFRLEESELGQIGILQSIRPMHWLVAGSPIGLEVNEAISRTLQPEHISADVVSVNLGILAWAVPREQFFRAQRALLAATNLNALRVIVVKPRFDLE